VTAFYAIKFQINNFRIIFAFVVEYLDTRPEDFPCLAVKQNIFGHILRHTVMSEIFKRAEMLSSVNCNIQ
jgi:hypothetical protein